VSPEQAVYERISQTATIVDLVADRIEPKRLPQMDPEAGPQTPALVYFLVDDQDETTQDNRSGLVRARIQVDAYAETYAAVVQLAGVVKAALIGEKWTASDGSRVWAFYGGGRDFAPEDPDVVLERRSADFLVTCRAPRQT